MCRTEVLSQQAKDRNKGKKCSVISSHRAQTDVEMLESKERPCSATRSRRMQAAAATLSALCTMLRRVPVRYADTIILLRKPTFTSRALILCHMHAVLSPFTPCFVWCMPHVVRLAAHYMHEHESRVKSQHILQVWATGLRVARGAAHVHPECTHRRWRQSYKYCTEATRKDFEFA